MKRIVSVSPHPTALTLALVFAVISLFFMLPMFFAFSFMPGFDSNGNSFGAGMPLGFILVMPFMYFIMTYIFTFIGCLLYNLMAKLTGGIAINLSD